MQATIAFTSKHRTAIASLVDFLERRTGAAILAEFDGTDDGGQQYACLTVDTLPVGSMGEPGALVSIVTGAGIPVGSFGVMGADGSILANGVTLAEALRVARSAGGREWRRVTKRTFYCAG